VPHPSQTILADIKRVGGPRSGSNNWLREVRKREKKREEGKLAVKRNRRTNLTFSQATTLKTKKERKKKKKKAGREDPQDRVGGDRSWGKKGKLLHTSFTDETTGKGVLKEKRGGRQGKKLFGQGCR